MSDHRETARKIIHKAPKIIPHEALEGEWEDLIVEALEKERRDTLNSEAVIGMEKALEPFSDFLDYAPDNENVKKAREARTRFREWKKENGM